jgi:SAM-dependent methyltransferase
MTNLNEQQNFWANDYASEYIQKNNKFDEKLGVEGWQKMLTKAEGITSILECGCNIGRNIRFLNKLLPDAEKSIIEISKPAYDFVISNFTIQKHFNGPIVNSVFESGSFDLAFVCGVLIHIHPDDLLANMAKLFKYYKRYILICE